ncbi:MAG: hypothetical protein E4H20_11460 [Spirochaetales bacterium]|nr:MAG: hypothetical protein E4H20_11460 [Spirochaetales bacterium]
MVRSTRPWLSAAALALILIAVLIPGSDLPDNPGIPGLDKIVHFILFAMLAAAIMRDFSPISGRGILDGIADMVGFITGISILLAIAHRSRVRRGTGA